MPRNGLQNTGWGHGICPKVTYGTDTIQAKQNTHKKKNNKNGPSTNSGFKKQSLDVESMPRDGQWRNTKAINATIKMREVKSTTHNDLKEN